MIAAFLDFGGRILIVVISESCENLGIENDRFVSVDKMLIFFSNITTPAIGYLHLEHIHFGAEANHNKLF